MPTDTERREAARRLREREDELTYDSTSLEKGLIDIVGKDGCDYVRRLADLMEPNRGSSGRSVLCAHCEKASWCGCEPGDEEGGCDFEPSVTEGEPPYNLYSLYEAVFRRRPRDEFAIEDDEVRELVNELLDICNAPGHEFIQRFQPSCDRDALLTVAETMDQDAFLYRGAARSFTECRNHDAAEICYEAAGEYNDYAKAIREALCVPDEQTTNATTC